MLLTALTLSLSFTLSSSYSCPRALSSLPLTFLLLSFTLSSSYSCPRALSSFPYFHLSLTEFLLLSYFLLSLPLTFFPDFLLEIFLLSSFPLTFFSNFLTFFFPSYFLLQFSYVFFRWLIVIFSIS